MTLNPNIIGYRCVSCGQECPPEPFRYTCAECKNNLEVVYDYASIGSDWSRDDLTANRDRSLWRYLPLLPVSAAPDNHTISAGGTPLVTVTQLAERYDLAALHIKDDSRNPSGSLKDRATEIALRHAHELGQQVLVAASTGNAASSLAALAAFYGKQAVILAPAAAPPAKLTQIMQYGATLCLIDGTYDEAFDLSVTAAEAHGWYCRSTGINPVLSEGKKTAALEIAEQLNWQVPDQVFVPVGDGSIISGVCKGFYDLHQLGWITSMPRVVAVQARGSAAIVNALAGDGAIIPVKADTIADSISVSLPRDGLKAVRAVRASGGYGIRVSDEDILRSQKQLSQDTGIFAEPAAAAAFAGLLQALNQGQVRHGESVVALITGSGLKDIPAAQQNLVFPAPIKPDPAAFNAFIETASQSGTLSL
ncbi:MAG: threonine synthase [Candidatus Marinimicrobia bacterium]|nr:threonine synthase [Candidatus Neomarinimicrobiota bacterium]